MSERVVTQICETESNGYSTVQVISTDEYGDQHVGTGTYENDTWHTSSDREDAYQRATEQSLYD